MALELHIWGPAFGLPSIDASCLAAIALLKKSLPNNTWRLIPNNNPNSNPFSQLPALRHGQLWIAGFRNITQYIYAEVRDADVLDADLTDIQLADREALFSFIEARGQPLLDLSLYVSSDNYTTCTRSALAEILEWPQSWTLPHRLRDKARKRSEHLGLSGLDVDAAREQQLKKEEEGLNAHIPKSLRRPKQTVSALLGSSAQSTRFRIEGVSADFFESLEARIAQHGWQIGSSMTSVDCLAIGMLSLMSLADLPQPWLEELLRLKYPKLNEWIQENMSEVFGSRVTSQSITSGNFTAESDLPWQLPAPRTWSNLASDVLDGTVGSIPFISPSPNVTAPSSLKTRTDSKYERRQAMHVQRRRRKLFRQEIVAACLSSATIIGWLMYVGVLPIPRRQPGPTRHEFGIIRRSFGEAGSFLGLG